MRLLARVDFGDGPHSEDAWNLYTAAVAKDPDAPDIARRAYQYGVRKLLVHAWAAHRDRILKQMRDLNISPADMAGLEQELMIAIAKIVESKAYTLPNTEDER